MQRAVPVVAGDTEETLTERVKSAEHVIYPQALQQVALGAICLGADGRIQRTPLNP